MKNILLAAMVAFVSLYVAACGEKGSAEVRNAYAFATNGVNGAVFLELVNTGKTDVQLKGVRTDVAGEAQLHTMAMNGDVMEMRPIDSLNVASGQTLSLNPSGDHVMLLGLKAPLTEGQTFAITLVTSAGDIAAQVNVNAPGAAAAVKEPVTPAEETVTTVPAAEPEAVTTTENAETEVPAAAAPETPAEPTAAPAQTQEEGDADREKMMAEERAKRDAIRAEEDKKREAQRKIDMENFRKKMEADMKEQRAKMDEEMQKARAAAGADKAPVTETAPEAEDAPATDAPAAETPAAE